MIGVRVDNLVFEAMVEAHPTLSAVVRPHLPNPAVATSRIWHHPFYDLPAPFYDLPHECRASHSVIQPLAHGRDPPVLRLYSAGTPPVLHV